MKMANGLTLDVGAGTSTKGNYFMVNDDVKNPISVGVTGGGSGS